MYVEGVGRGVDDGRRNEWVEKVVESVVLKSVSLRTHSSYRPDN